LFEFQDGKKGVEVIGSAAGVKDCIEAINAKIGGGRPPRKSKKPSMNSIPSLNPLDFQQLTTTMTARK
jgi:hypothetical protein